MNRAIIGTLVGVMTLATISWVSATENSTTMSDINAIHDPYEQCLVYVKLKKIDGVDCKARIGGMQNTRGTGVLIGTGSTKPRIPEDPRPPVESGISMSDINHIKDPYEQCLAYVKFKKLVGIDCKAKVEAIKNARGNTGTGDIQTRPSHPPMGTGATTGTGNREDHPECRAPGSCGQGLPPVSTQMGHDMQYIGAAIMKLNDADRTELVKMIRTYLETKGVKISTQENMNDRKDDVMNMRDELKDTLKDIKTKNRDEIRAQQEFFRTKLEEMKKSTSTM